MAECPQAEPFRELEQDIDAFVSVYLPPDVDAFLTQHLRQSSGELRCTHKVVHDGLWGTLRLRPAEVCFLDTPLAQRLRHIHQMGLCWLTYPSTTHTRFEHTLGVMLQVRKLGEALLKADQTEKRLTEADVGDMRFAALFHDLGHGPHSHSSEEVYCSLPGIDSVYDERYSRRLHETLSALIVRAPRFRAFSKEVENRFKVRIPLDELADYIRGDTPTGREPYSKELLNGPFDADKVDYLFRDSHFSGLPMSVDLDRLWYAVRIAEAKGQSRLVQTQSGATCLEQILFSKMILFATVYHHHKVRACDCMFAGIIEYMRENPKPAFEKNGRALTWHSPADFLWVTDHDFVSLGFQTKDENLHNLIHNLYFRRLLKRAVILSHRTIHEGKLSNAAGLLRNAKKGPVPAQERRRIALKIWERAGKPCLPQEVWLDLPESPDLTSADKTFVLPAETGRLPPVPLSDFFPTTGWATRYDRNKWRGHVFCPPQHRERVAKATRDVLGEEFDMELKPEAYLWCKVTPPR